LHGKLDDVDIYIQPPTRYPCSPGSVLKLKKAIYGLHQAPIKFKTEVVDWFRQNDYEPANDSQTIWIQRRHDKLLIHALYADDFLHFTNDTALYNDFQKQFRHRFDVTSGTVGVYLGNHIHVDKAKLAIGVDQTAYIDDLLARFDMSNCKPVHTPIEKRLSDNNAGDKLSSSDHA